MDLLRRRNLNGLAQTAASTENSMIRNSGIAPPSALKSMNIGSSHPILLMVLLLVGAIVACAYLNCWIESIRRRRRAAKIMTQTPLDKGLD
eukprot:scaffold5887_cov122-Cylindrotheca_fusiformis.AAC.2